MEAVDVIRLETEGDATDGAAASTAEAASSETVTGKEYEERSLR